MTPLQNDVLEIYNSLVVFSDNTIKSKFPVPISVKFDTEFNALRFEQKGKTVLLQVLTNYCLGLSDLTEPTWLLPEDYDYIMSSMQSVIASGDLLKPKTCLSPENYGFNLFAVNPEEPAEGPGIIAQIKFISGTSWLFKLLTKRKYRKWKI